MIGRNEINSYICIMTELPYTVDYIELIQEYINGGIVKNLVNRIPMQVVRYDVDRETNPWGLALNGPGIYQPKLIEDK